MQLSKMKNIIVLRGMSSNVVEEAIVVLKPNIKLKQNVKIKGKTEKSVKNMIVMKEAENIIDSYIQKIQKDRYDCYEEKFKIKYRFLQVSNSVLIIGFIITILLLY